VFDLSLPKDSLYRTPETGLKTKSTKTPAKVVTPPPSETASVKVPPAPTSGSVTVIKA